MKNLLSSAVNRGDMMTDVMILNYNKTIYGRGPLGEITTLSQTRELDGEVPILLPYRLEPKGAF